MSKKYTVPRGCADIVVPEVYRWQLIENILRERLRTYNYQEIRTPIFEETDLFARSMGQSSDVVMKQMLNLASQRRTEDGLLELSGQSLRPENTASVVRSYIQQGLQRKESLTKLYYMGPMFRGERPQKGRLRQFHQVGVEAIGSQSDSPFLDAEVIALAADLLKTSGINEFTVNINTLGSAADKETFSVWLRDQLKPHLADLDEEDQSRYERNVFRVLDSKNAKTRAVVERIDTAVFALHPDSRSYFNQVLGALDALKVPYKVNPKLVRGLDYYTHTVFEITGSGLGSQDALGAGGRYNHLVKQLGGPEVGAVGFALGVERILLALPSDQGLDEPAPQVYVVAFEEDVFSEAWKLTSILRQHSVSADIAYKVSSVKSLMRQANKSRARWTLILGKDEFSRGVVILKEMESGSQQEVPVRDQDYQQLIDILKERL